VDVYGHLIPGANRAAVDRLDEPVPPYTEVAAGNQRIRIGKDGGWK
jgi:hypothetical protein